MSFFPVFANFMDGEEFKGLTPTETLYFWHLVSEFNLRGELYQSDLEIAVTLATSEKTIRRGRAKLTAMGVIKAKPGTRTRRNQCLATSYLHIKYAVIEGDGFFAQMPRHTFNAMLDRLRKSRFQAGDVVVYVSLYYWFWRNRGKYEERDRFYITKKRLQLLTNLNDASTRILRIYEAIVFSGGKNLFEYQEEHHRVIFRDWTWCADPDHNEQNRRNEERYKKEIKDLVAQEKRDRQLKVQQMFAKTSLLPFEFFKESYKKKHGRFPDYNSSIKEEFHDVEKAYGYGLIYRAINCYFSAEVVPNGTKAKTRTLGNFIKHIDDIIKLSSESVFV